MAEDSALQVQTAHIAALKADVTLQGFIGTKIYDYVPENTAYPYIVYHIAESDEWDTTTEDGDEHSVYVHVWDDAEGSKRTRQINQRVFELLHDNASYSLTDHNMVNARRVMRAVDREGQLYHGVQLFRVVTEET